MKLTREGYDVVGEAGDGLEAVELYKSLKPDIVLLDIVMPNCDINYEIAQQIHSVSADDMYILGTNEVDMIMKTVRSQADAHEVKSTITRLKERSPAEQQGYDPTIEQRAHINARLEKLEQGQEEILDILRTLKNSKE